MCSIFLISFTGNRFFQFLNLIRVSRSSPLFTFIFFPFCCYNQVYSSSSPSKFHNSLYVQISELLTNLERHKKIHRPKRERIHSFWNPNPKHSFLTDSCLTKGWWRRPLPIYVGISDSGLADSPSSSMAPPPA